MTSTTTRDNNHKSVHVQELRVADQELSAGNHRGKVFLQLSPGAVAFLTDRPVAHARVSRHLQAAIDADSPIAPRMDGAPKSKK